MARQGRQPKQITSNVKPTKSKAGKKGKKQSTSTHSNEDKEANLDVYSFSSSVKRPRGDVDPAARASSKPARSSKANGKQKARKQADEEEEDNDEELSDEDDEDEDSENDGFRVRGNEVVDFTGIKPAGLKMGMGSEDEGFGSDDEDIDSDFSDEMSDVPPRKATKSSKSAAVSTEIDLDEDEVDSEDEDGDGFMDASEMFDRSGDDDSDEEESDSGEDEEMELDDEELSLDGDEDDGAALDKLDDFVQGLESKKRKAGDRNDEAGGKKKKRVILKERTEAYPEGEFVAVGTDSNDNRVQLEDLLSSFADSKNPRLANLRKTLKPLAATSDSNAAVPTGSTSALKRAGPISAPLPARLQDKIDREAAFEKTKEETDKWNDTVKRMKGESGAGVSGARHERLVLPLIDPTIDAKRAPNSNELSAKFQPTNELEASIQSLLAAGQMQQTDLEREEQAQLATLDPADLAARRAELRRQRDLMYRAERKAKRVAKIKSKAYRRIHRKGKDKDGPQLSLEDLEELDRIDGGDRVAEERSRLEILRAKERATLKHSAKGGRWAKKVDGLDGLEDERNKAIRDMVERRDQLRKKIAGIEDDEVDEFAPSGSEEEGASDAEADFDSIRNSAFNELASLDAKEAAAAANDPKIKGVMNMKFMKDARARADREVQKEADDLRRRLEQMDEIAEREDEEDAPLALSEQVQGNLGRMVFGPSVTLKTATADDEVEDSTVLKPTTTTKMTSVSIDSPSTSSRPTFRSRPSLSKPDGADDPDVNPWLALADDNSARVSRKSNKASFGKDSLSAAEKTAGKATRAKSKQGDARQAERDDAEVELDLSAGLVGVGSKKKRDKAPQVGGAVSRPAEAMEEEADDSDVQSDEEIEAQRGRGPTAFKQRALVKEAFANDDVVAEFEEEKRKEIERDAPREEDNTLPGWGSWSGKGAKKNKNAKKFVKKIAGIDAADRKDAGLNHVIINEKKDKKAAKYMLKDLPFPYTSAAQHEHKLRTPMGPEWSTSTVLRDQTIPSVLVKPGATIRPVARRV